VSMKSISLNIDFHVVSHCNLNCARCSHFASVADKEYMDVWQFKRDLWRLRELGVKLDCITLCGGEPLLHPAVLTFARIADDVFPHVKRQICTNGTLLKKQTTFFYEILRNTNTAMRWSKYPFDYGDTEDYLKRHGVQYEIVDKTLMHEGVLNLIGSGNMYESFKQCFFKTCPCVHNGRFYKCFVSANFRHVNKRFNLGIEEPAGLDIHKASLLEFLEYVEKPIPFCRYCDFRNGEPLARFGWKVTEGLLDEFTRVPLNG